MKSNTRLNKENLEAEKKSLKKQTAAFTIMNKNIEFVKKESERLGISRSALVDMIISTYAILPITDEDLNEEDLESGDDWD